MRRKILIELLLLLFLVTISINTSTAFAAKPNTQTITIPVESDSVDAKPVVWYYQQDKGHFKVLNTVGGELTSANEGSDNSPFPKQTEVHQHLNIKDYPATTYRFTFHLVNEKLKVLVCQH
ncbi:hypothetical protein I6G82_06660 [Lysinibacillus macroides]|uniref:Uncharacterized protein n=1 Tax=Lysinibacillus macroides TaxID=33935 RepID=A0A0N0CWT0_9BACI|nr:hypothetical protein [Lysinibacillus macroides]KOY83417.1 hypothetical protein ADM90_09145 [Lysinibacillus macroides]QPR69286.1 hypothetical protein I6G82_06660 [Lysinibacillus macroides]